MTENKSASAKSPDAGKPKGGAVGRQPPAELPPDGVAADTAVAEPAVSGRKRDWVPVLYIAGFVVLAAAIVWVWQNPPVVPPPPPSPDIAALHGEIHALEDRIARLEQRPAAAAAAADLAPLTARVAALEARKPPPPVDLGPLQAAVATLEKRPVGDPPLGARVDALAGRLDALTGRIDSAQTALTQMQAANAQKQDALQQKQDAVDARLAPLEKNAGQITSLADRAAHIARIQAAQAALDSGVKLGDLPGAPAPLARYATAAPPTEASLRLSFPPVASAALAASRPMVDDKPFLERAWAQAQDLVTLRQGDHVIVGDPAAGVLARAKASLDVGDLAGAVAALNALTGPAAAAMAGWKAQAQGLLDARQALADMAAHA